MCVSPLSQLGHVCAQRLQTARPLEVAVEEGLEVGLQGLHDQGGQDFLQDGVHVEKLIGEKLKEKGRRQGSGMYVVE